MGDLIIPLRPRFQITLILSMELRSQYFNQALKVELEPTHGGTHYSTKAPISNHQTSKFRHFGSRVLPIRKFKV